MLGTEFSDCFNTDLSHGARIEKDATSAVRFYFNTACSVEFIYHALLREMYKKLSF